MKGTDCARSYMVAEDHAAVKRSGESGEMVLEMLSITCALDSSMRTVYTQVYRDSCSQVATMYELGWGVDKNMEKSKEWLNKAGL